MNLGESATIDYGETNIITKPWSYFGPGSRRRTKKLVTKDHSQTPGTVLFGGLWVVNSRLLRLVTWNNTRATRQELYLEYYTQGFSYRNQRTASHLLHHGSSAWTPSDAKTQTLWPKFSVPVERRFAQVQLYRDQDPVPVQAADPNMQQYEDVL